MISAPDILPNAWPHLTEVQRARADATTQRGIDCGLGFDRVRSIGGAAELEAIEISPPGDIDWEFAVAALEDDVRMACDRRMAAVVAGSVAGFAVAIGAVYYMAK